MEPQVLPSRSLGSKFLKKFSDGIALGLGFSLALGFMILLMYLSDPSNREKSENEKLESWQIEFTSSTRLSVEWHEARSSNYNLHVLGAIKNDDETTWESVSVEVNLFDSDGKFIWQCGDYIPAPVWPGDTHKFHVDCNGVSSDPVPEHSTYTVEIVDARAT